MKTYQEEDMKLDKTKECPSGKTLHPRTGRCRKNKVKRECPSGKTLHPRTGRCRKNKVKRECPSGKTLHPRTGRCRKNKVKASKTLKNKETSCVSGVDGPDVYDVKTKGVLLAMVYKGDVDIDGWWASEKWDGYRAVWNGKSFVSRAGKRFDVPDWYRSIMPPGVALDGELWLGREKFEECGLFRRKKPQKETDIIKWNDEWVKKDVKFKVFDIINDDNKFEDRMNRLKKIVKDRNSCVKASQPKPLSYTEQKRVSTEEAIDMAKDIIKEKGEGIMLRKPGSLYEAKRSKTLYKIKETDDTEAIIIGYKSGKGKYSQLLGAFQCTLVDDPRITFNVSGMKDDVRNSYKTTHPIGTKITITYNGFTGSGVPRHPRYLRIRHEEGH